MRMDKLTSRFQSALADAQSLAVGRDNQFIEPAHLLLAMIDARRRRRPPLLLKAGVDVESAARAAQRDPRRPAEGRGHRRGRAGLERSGRLLNVTDKLAQKRGDQFISSELFVLAAFEDRGAVARALKECARHARGDREGDR